MSTLQARLAQAMKHGKKSKSDLARACDISTAAVAKWFGETAKNLKMEHLFAVADACEVNPRWLAGLDVSMIKSDQNPLPADIPQRRIELIRMYGRLPDEVRFSIRQLIESLAYLEHPHKAEYVKRQVRKPETVHDE